LFPLSLCLVTTSRSTFQLSQGFILLPAVMAAAAVAEPTPLAVSTQGIAFEVDIKNPGAAEVMTPVRARLEKEAAGARPLPRLLHASHEDASGPDSPQSPQKEGVAERARARNEKRQAVVERTRRDFEELIDLKRTSLDRDLERAAQLRQTSLADKSSKAGKHFEEVKAKVGDVQRQQADATAEQQRKLEEALAMKGAAHSAGIIERGTRAGQHNGRVAEKVQKHQEEIQRRLQRLREQQQAAQRRADELREQRRHKGSATNGAGRPASAPASPSRWSADVGLVGAMSMPVTPSGCGNGGVVGALSAATP